MDPTSFLSGLDAFMKQQRNGQSRPGDDDYPQYHLPPFLQSERMFLNLNGQIPTNKERAFTIANKATTAIEQLEVDKAEKMAYHALSLDPECIDAWRILAKCLSQFSDGDTVVCALREILNFARPFYKQEFEEAQGQFYNYSNTRPYMRILIDLASIAFQSDELDVATHVYEEMIRLNHRDNTGARNELLACYIKVIGRLRKYPKSKPVRTIEQAMALINNKWPSGDGSSDPLFEDDNITVRWAKIAFEYAKKGKWQELAKAEYKKNPLMFQVIFNEKDVSKIPPASPHGYGYLVGDPSDDVRAHGHMIQEAYKEWPDLIIDLAKLFREKIANQSNFIKEIKAQASNPDNDLSKQNKEHMAFIGNEFLSTGRETLRKSSFSEALQYFTLAKRGFFEACQPSRRFYLHAPFAIVSNRATCAAYLSSWNLVRIDVRYTLTMQPDHQRSYLRTLDVVKAFKAKQLIPEFTQIVQNVKEKPDKPLEEWKELAKQCIGLISIPALVAAHDGHLTEDLRKQVIETGIEDMYTTVNVDPSVHPILPWLQNTDIEPPIEKK